MTLTDLLQAQLLDPFRIGLMLALLYTALRNQAATGLVLPLLAGVAFIAVMLPATMGLGQAARLGLWTVVGVGAVANALILAVLLAGWWAVQRFRS